MENVSDLVRTYSKEVLQERPVGSVSKIVRGHIEAEYGNGIKYHFKYASEPFNKFGQTFEFLKYDGAGESINKEYLEEAVEKGVHWIVVGHLNGNIYRYPAEKWLEWSKNPPEEERLRDYRGEDVNTIRTTQYQTEKETTASIPFTELEQVEY